MNIKFLLVAVPTTFVGTAIPTIIVGTTVPTTCGNIKFLLVVVPTTFVGTFVSTRLAGTLTIVAFWYVKTSIPNYNKVCWNNCFKEISS